MELLEIIDMNPSTGVVLAVTIPAIALAVLIAMSILKKKTKK